MTSIRKQISSVYGTCVEGSVHPINDTITFPPIDVNWVLQPHEDALILTHGVGRLDVRRILVDPGNLANLLQISAYRQMGYSPSALENLGCLLSRFNEATTTSLSDIVLHVQSDLIIMSVRFSVVNDLSLSMPLWDMHDFTK